QDKPQRKEKLLRHIGLWFMRYTPAVMVDTADGLLCDITGCAHLWGGEEAYLRDMEQQLRQRGYQVCTGIAPTLGAAWAIARYGASGSIVPDGEQEKALSALPIACLRLDVLLLE